MVVPIALGSLFSTISLRGMGPFMMNAAKSETGLGRLVGSFQSFTNKNEKAETRQKSFNKVFSAGVKTISGLVKGLTAAAVAVGVLAVVLFRATSAGKFIESLLYGLWDAFNPLNILMVLFGSHMQELAASAREDLQPAFEGMFRAMAESGPAVMAALREAFHAIGLAMANIDWETLIGAITRLIIALTPLIPLFITLLITVLVPLIPLFERLVGVLVILDQTIGLDNIVLGIMLGIFILLVPLIFTIVVPLTMFMLILAQIFALIGMFIGILILLQTTFELIDAVLRAIITIQVTQFFNAIERAVTPLLEPLRILEPIFQRIWHIMTETSRGRGRGLMAILELAQDVIGDLQRDFQNFRRFLESPMTKPPFLKRLEELVGLLDGK